MIAAWARDASMHALHVTPTRSAAHSLRQALAEAGHDEPVIAYPDDLSCGPIATDDTEARSLWWADINGEADDTLQQDLHHFWERVREANDNCIAWVGRNSALDYVFFVAFAARLNSRSVAIVDVTDHSSPSATAATHEQPTRSVSILPPYALGTLIGTQQTVTATEHEALRARWKALQHENAYFRIATPTGLVSVPEHYFDPAILACATPEPQPARRVIAETMAHPLAKGQVGDIMLFSRLIALIGEGHLIADDTVENIQVCLVRLPRGKPGDFSPDRNPRK